VSALVLLPPKIRCVDRARADTGVPLQNVLRAECCVFTKTPHPSPHHFQPGLRRLPRPLAGADVVDEFLDGGEFEQHRQWNVEAAFIYTTIATIFSGIDPCDTRRVFLVIRNRNSICGNGHLPPLGANLNVTNFAVQDDSSPRHLVHSFLCHGVGQF